MEQRGQRIPSRHPDRPRPVPAGVQRFAQLLGLRAPTAEQWREIGDSLTVGDEPMDQLVEWMSTAGMTEIRPVFDRILADGIATVPDAPVPLRTFFGVIEATPDWVEPEKLRKAQRAMRRGGADGIHIARDVSLLGGYQMSGFNKTLLRTGALEKGSNKRFAETMQWALDVIVDGGLLPGGIGYRSTIRVRLIHSFVRRHVTALPDWRGDDWGLPVNQTDMAATLVGALVAPSVGGLAMGIMLRPAELDAIAHLTRYVGWLIGVQDEWLPRSFRDCIRILYHTSSALFDPDESSKQLAVPMADDPLEWHYPTLPGLRRQLARAQHLSLASAFLGRRAMRALGLPAFVLPWYPLLRIPFNLLNSASALLVPGGAERAADRGMREQKALLRTMIGDDAGAAIGDSAAHVSVA